MSFSRDWYASVGRDAALALRSFRKSPLFAASVVATLALGIGANTTIFTVTKAVLLDSLPFRFMNDPARLVMLWEKAPKFSSFFAERMPVRLKDLRRWQEANRSFAGIGAWRETSLNLTQQGIPGKHPLRVSTAVASPDLLPLLGVRPRLGRPFRREDGESAENHVAILSDEIYRSQFSGDPDVLSRTVQLDGVSYRIIGVLPAGFELPAMGGGFDQKKVLLWLPLDMHPAQGVDEQNNLFVYARLNPGVTPAAAQAEMTGIQRRLAKSDQALAFLSGVNVSSIFDEDVGPDLRSTVLVLQVAVGFVLLIACANVANLSLTRAVAQEKEFAVRTALGAGRFRLLRQMLTESLMLSGAAACVGGLLSYWGVRTIDLLAPKDTHGLHEMTLDWTTFGFTAAVCVLTGMLFGLAPYSHIRKQDINEVMNRTSRSISASSRRSRELLITVELALSVVLLIGAGLMIRTLAVLMSTNLGFQTQNLFSVQVSLPEKSYRDRARVEQFDRDLLASVRELPGVQSAMLTNDIPMQSVSQASYGLGGKQYAPSETPVASWARVSSGYFETLGMRVFAGRTFSPNDSGSGLSAVAVVNQEFARVNAPKGDILGQTIDFGGEDGKQAHFRIIGIVENERQLGPDHAGQAEFYLPAHALSSMYLILRTSGNPFSVAPQVESAIWKLDSDLPVGEVRSMEGVLRDWTAPRRFVMSILVCFGTVAVILAAVGLFGSLAYSVSLRTREIGVRLALGAEPRTIARDVLWGGLKLTLMGTVLGMAASIALVHYLASIIYGVSSNDPVTFGCVPLLLAVVAALACYAPARRAASVDPVEALRAE